MVMPDIFEIEEGVLKAYKGAEHEVTVPDGVTAIGDGAFKGLAWLKKVKLPDSVKSIGNTAFKGCRQLEEISISGGLTEIGEYAFHRCHKLKELVFPKSLKKVGDFAFLYCDGLEKAVIEGPERLGTGAFSHNLSLTRITLNKNIDDTNFKEEVFEGCIALKTVILSDTAYEVENLIDAMNSHSAYPEVIKSMAKSVYHSMQIEDGVLNKFSINLKSVTLPEGITAIGKSCFFDKKGVTFISLPKSLKEIRANAFLNCLSLEEISLFDENTELDDKAFRGCNNLKRVCIGGKVYDLDKEHECRLVSRIRDQVLGDFYISGRILMRYLGDEEQITIPEGVEVIGERAFFGKEQLKTVICPDGLTKISEQAFASCLTLQNIVLPESLKRVEREAFAECRKLLKCNLPDTMEYIGEYAFRRCMTLKLPDGIPGKAYVHPYAFYRSGQSFDTAFAVNMARESSPDEAQASADDDKTIAAYAFARKDGISVIKLSGIKRIGKYAYAGCKDLEEVIIDSPDCIVEQDTFNACPKLKKVYLNVKEIGKGIFSYCRELKEVCLAGVSYLPAESFAGCNRLKKFEAKDLKGMAARCFDECTELDAFDFSGIKEIGERAFERCDSLKTADLAGVRCAYHSFADCAGLETVKITDSTVLKSNVFTGCTQIKNIEYCGKSYSFSRFKDSLNHTDNHFPYTVREVIASVYSCFDIREGKILSGYLQDAAAVTVPGDIEEIGQDVFRDHIRLKKITIPDTVRLFGSHAFTMTSWLEEEKKANEMVIVNKILIDGTACKGRVVIPDDVRRISGWCFAGNISIKELVIPSDRIAIENLAFRNCLNLKKILTADKKEYVLKSVADLDKCDYPDTVKRIFAESINCFKLDDDGRLIESTGNITALTFPEGITGIGDGVYKDCHLLESVLLSKDTARIGRSAFENSKWLKTVGRAGNLKEIGAQAFSGCQSLESIDVSDSLTVLGKRCFEHCCSLLDIHISYGLEAIPERAFFRCKGLKKLFIPESVKIIESEAFAFCEGLEEVQISKNTKVAENAFACCKDLKIARY